jgi:hypothetical protein
MLFGTTNLANGTAFFWKSGEDTFLITNWHNVSGKDPRTNKHLSSTAAEPDTVRVWWNRKDKPGVKFPEEVPLLDQAGQPRWLEHATHGNRVDVIALPLRVPGDAAPFPINDLPSDDLRLLVGHDLFILGYPFRVGPYGYPIWKRGSFASEPAVIDPSDPYMLVDTASRPGMSGAPVIRRSWGFHQKREGDFVGGEEAATSIVGVYSGRLAATDPNDPQLGMVWPIYLVEEIIARARQGAG